MHFPQLSRYKGYLLGDISELHPLGEITAFLQAEFKSVFVGVSAPYTIPHLCFNPMQNAKEVFITNDKV